MKDYYKELEKRLKRHNFKALPPLITGMKVNQTINHVFDLEFKERFKSAEYRLIFRLDVWIELNAIETTNKSDRKKDTKSHTQKQKRPSSTIGKFRGYSLGNIFSKSLDNLDSLTNEVVEIKNNYDENMNRKVKSDKGKDRFPSYPYVSTELSNKTGAEEFLGSSNKYDARPKRKSKFFLFRRKGGSLNTPIKQKNRYSYTENEYHLVSHPAWRECIPENKSTNDISQQNFHTVSFQKQTSLFSITPRDSLRQRGARPTLCGPVTYTPTEETSIGQM